MHDLRPLLRAELRRPGDSQDALTDACRGFRSAMTFATALETLEFDERWLDADGEEAEPWTSVRFALGDIASITRATSDDALRRIARDVRAAYANIVIVDLEHYSRRIRDQLEFG